MEFRLYVCQRYRKDVKSISGLTKHITACKILIFLQYCQPVNPKPVLDHNISNPLYLLSNNNKKNISLGVSNNGKKKIRLVNIDIDKKDIRLRDIVY